MTRPQDHEPERNCPHCPRLAGFRETHRAASPDWHNAPVAGFGGMDARLLVVGLAPGLRGANRTGRPFTGDWAGDLLYETLLDFGFATGTYRQDPADGLRLRDCRIVNAVRCVPPQNRPTGAEIAACRPFLEAEIRLMPQLRAILCLGRVSHESLLRAFRLRLADFPFQHAAQYRLPDGPLLFDSYHCSRYNTNTGRLTREMFRTVAAAVRTATHP